MKNLFLLSIAFLIMSAVTLPQKEKKSYSESIQKSAQTTVTLSASFVQKKYLAALQDVVVSKGEFLLKKPDKIRWHYTAPFLYTITIDGTMVTMKDQTKTEKYDMKKSASFRQLNEVILGSIDGSILKKKELFTFHFSEEKEDVKLLLSPKKSLFPLKNITIYFDKKELLVRRVVLTEKNKDYTDIIFSNTKKNGTVNHAIFTH